MKVYVRDVKSKKNNRYPIYLRVIHNGVKSEGLITSIENVSEKEKDYWNAKEERFDKGLKDHNIIISELRGRFKEYLFIKRNDLTQITSNEIKDYLLNRCKENQSSKLEDAYINFISKHIDPRRDLSDGTKRNYLKSRTHFFNFLEKEKKKKISINGFSKTDALSFKTYLLSKMTPVSAQSVLKNVKPFFNFLADEDKIKSNPFEKIYITIEEVQQTDIESMHYSAIKKLKFHNFKTIEVYRDIFLVMSMTGMIYQDLYNFKRSNIYTKNGHKFIKYNRLKTKISSTQIIPNELELILNKYVDDPTVLIEDYLMPLKGLNEINKQLKNIGHMINLPFPLTTYHARRFFRQAMSEVEISEELTKKCLMGHSVRKDITSRYLKVKDKMLIKASSELNTYFEKL